MDIEAIRSSFSLLSERAEELAGQFYKRLFKDFPAVMPLFEHVDEKQQAKKLASALALLVNTLEKPEALSEVLIELGRKHEGYGAEPAHYDAVKQTLLGVMAEMAGDAWSPHLQDTWDEVLSLVAEKMLEGYGENHITENTDSLERRQTMSSNNGSAESQDCVELQGIYNAIDRVQAIIEFDLDGNILTANKNFCDVMGYALEELEGKHHSMFAEESYKNSPEYTEFWKKLGRGEYDAGEYKRLGKDGNEIWIQASYNPIFDEAGKLTKVVKFATDITEQKQQATENSRIRQALDSAKSNVMLADADHNIIYMNGAVDQLFRDKEAEIRQDLPRFDASKLIGTNMDVFHKDPSHQRRMVEGLTEPYSVIAEVGGLSFRINATPLTSASGKRTGTVVEWDDATLELAAEREAMENARIKQALDSATSSIMLADANNNILYVNATVVSMFRSAEAKLREALPGFSADDLVGKNMDIFHKNPSHQKGLVNGLSSSYTGQAEVAGLTFEVVANPLVDEDGTRIGTVVEWKNRTQELAVEEEVQDVLGRVARGDLTQRVEGDYTGFFGVLKDNINATVEKLNAVEAEVKSVLSKVVEGNLTSQIEGEYEGFFGSLKDNINATVFKLIDVVQQIKEVSDSVATGSEEICQGNANLSQRTEEQASSLEETSSSMEEMTSTVQQNAENAREADKLAQGAKDKAEHGGEVVSNAVTAMAEINGASKRIADIISVIDEIAFQTNLLALNASVEAARAGEQGRGFAVVASEVRNLAGRSATAAKEIKELIEDSVGKVEQGSKLVDESGQTLQEIISAVQSVTDIVGEISGASVEQAAGIEEVNKAISLMDEMTQQNAALVEQAAAASEAMGDQAGELKNQMNFFNLSGEQQASVPSQNRARNDGKVVEWKKPDRAQQETPPAAPASMKAASNGGAGDWEEF